MKQIIFLILLSTLIFSQEKDSTLLKKYEGLASGIQKDYAERVDYLTKRDSVCQQIKGQFTAIQYLITEEKKKLDVKK